MPNTALLPLLANGEFHSGQDLAQTIGVSRTAVWKQLNKLEELGLQIESVKGKGYRIPGGIDLIVAQRVRAGLRPEVIELLQELDVHEVIDSTNMEAQRRIELGGATGYVCTAEQQTSGRGRRGRTWVSPFARNVYLSLVWEFTQGAAALEGMSLAVGVAVARALESCGISGVQLKWPNDLLYQKAKLGGVLLEMLGDATGTCQVVVGVGLNVDMPADSARGIDQAWTDLSAISGDKVVPDRSALIAALLNQLLPLLAGFQESGFGKWQQAWLERDAHADKSVILHVGEDTMAGTARGVDERGALLLETTVGIKPIYGGEISLRVDE
ncbi:MAG: bifunctional biotin--[acetyl-CoA-carboxylase] ligase/biotin operon repressor BirA [Halioglobus sp.]